MTNEREREREKLYIFCLYGRTIVAVLRPQDVHFYRMLILFYSLLAMSIKQRQMFLHHPEDDTYTQQTY